MKPRKLADRILNGQSGNALREGIATTWYYYYPPNYDWQPSVIKLNPSEIGSISDDKLLTTAGSLLEDFDHDPTKSSWDRPYSLGTKPMDDGEGFLPGSKGFDLNQYASDQADELLKPDPQREVLPDSLKSGTEIEYEETDGYTSAKGQSSPDTRKRLDLEKSNHAADATARETKPHYPVGVWIGSIVDSLSELIVKAEYFAATDLCPSMREMQLKLQNADDRYGFGKPLGGYKVTSAQANHIVSQLREKLRNYPDEGIKRNIGREVDKLEMSFDGLLSGL